jgi:hypothetical protein
VIRTLTPSLATAALAIALGCKPELPPQHASQPATPEPPASEPSPAPPESPPIAQAPSARLVWLRNAAVVDSSRQQVLERIEAPVQVELSGDGRVRSAPGSPTPLDGYIDPLLLRSPADGQGLALYAQEPSELHDGAPDGPVIGTLGAGAFVSVASLDAEWVQVAIPAFAKPSAPSGSPLVAFVRAAALGAEPKVLAPVATPPAAARVVRDYPADIPLAPTAASDEAFAATLCGDIRVLDEQPPRALIAQSHAGVELRGWVDAPVQLQRGPVRCTLRQVYRQGDQLISIDGTTAADRAVVTAVPSHYVSLDPTHGEHLLDVLRKATPLHWLVSNEHGATCQKWKPSTLKPDTEPGMYTGKLSGAPLASAAKLGVPSFTWRYRAATPQAPAELVLFGPHFARAKKPARPKQESSSGYRSGSVYTVVGATPEALRVFPAPLSDSVVAWHPDDEEHWFFSDASCRAAARAAEPALKANERTPPGGVHINPFPELDG